MKERPILMSAEMIRATLDGRKTKTRRIIPYQPEIDPQTGDWLWGKGKNYECVVPIRIYTESRRKLCRYGIPGDRLWVRETWRPKGHNFPTGWPYEYRATAEQDGTPTDGPWKPSIFMPRSASRILLEVQEINVERLHDISEEDAISEGVESWVETRWKSEPTHYKIYHREPGDESTYSSTAKYSFETLWKSINGPESWRENPFVWVINFKHLNHAHP